MDIGTRANRWPHLRSKGRRRQPRLRRPSRCFAADDHRQSPPDPFRFNVSEPEYVRYSRLAANGQRLSSSVPGNVVQIRLADEEEWIRNGGMDFIDNQGNGKS